MTSQPRDEKEGAAKEVIYCEECGQHTLTVTPDYEAGMIFYNCPCGYSGSDDWCDVYGVMSHPSGFLC